MFDWMVFYDTVISYIQWFASACFFCLIGIACIGFLTQSKRTSWGCIIVAIALFIIAYIVDDKFGVQLFAPQIMDFLERFL